MGKINLNKPLSKEKIKEWESFIRFWDSWGLKPKKAFKILGKYYLDHKENFIVNDMNVFDRMDNRKIFVSMIGYIYWYMETNKIRWNAALEELCKNNDEQMFIGLRDMLVPGAVMNGYISWSPGTFKKRMKQWRQYFFDQGWLHKDMRPEIIESRKALEKKGIIEKRKNKKVAKAIGKAINSKIFTAAIKKKKKKK